PYEKINNLLSKPLRKQMTQAMTYC
ncbi:hypothetical protein NPIL_335461, partial [Nephila pilipes]